MPLIEIPATALTNAQPPARRLDRRSARAARCRSATSTSCASTSRGRVSGGLDTGEIVVTAGVQALHPGQKVRLLGIEAMSGFNLSEWALGTARIDRLPHDRRGAAPALRPTSGSAATRIRPSSSRPWWFRPPGRAPPSRTRSSRSPSGSSASCRRRPSSISCAASPRAGVTTIFVNLQGSATASEIPDIWYHVRKSIGDIRAHPAGRRHRPGLQRRFRRHVRHHLRLHGRWLHASRAARLCRGHPLRSSCRSPTSPRSRSWAPRTSGSSSSSRCRSSPASASTARR